MKKVLFVWMGCLTILSNILSAQNIRPSQIRISLLTAAPGKELFAAWGHSAIRIRIDSSGYDMVYNYGTFDFGQPNFYANFARGRMNYRLSATTCDRFMADYIYENREVREQVFALDSVQTMFVVQFLENNDKPENRYYRYHFFLDNCATRIRDLVQQTCRGMELPVSEESPTYRDLIHIYLKDRPWGRFGTDIALGLPTDQKTGTFEQAFLPDYMFDAFAKILYHGRPIVKETKKIFIPDQPAVQPPGPLTPTMVCCLTLALAVLFSYVRKGSKIFDFVLFFTVGLVGLLVTFLWFFTDHTNTQNNLNIIWALPAHLALSFFLLSGRRSRFVRYYFLATAMIAMLLLVAWVFLPQPLNPSLIPLVLAVALRAFRIFRMP
ncbi:MAG: DUF4105 domain-containing protein [Bacteroidales bacterium]|jgi:hypothetical protein|nr:DUF4105 domain-containing protein [Bacteroidales bacterium]